MPDKLRARIDRAVGMHLRPGPETPQSPDEIAIVDDVMVLLHEAIAEALHEHAPDDLDQFIREQAAKSPEFAAATVEAQHAAKVRAFEDLLSSIWLYVPWHHVTKQLTTEQKEIWADAIDAHHARMNADEPHINPNPVDRWWRQ